MGKIIGNRRYASETYPDAPKPPSSGGGVASVLAGTGIDVNSDDPANPIVLNIGVLSVSGIGAIVVDNTNPQTPVVTQAPSSATQAIDTLGGGPINSYDFGASWTPTGTATLVTACACWSCDGLTDNVRVTLSRDDTGVIGPTQVNVGTGPNAVSVTALDTGPRGVATAYRITILDEDGGNVSVIGGEVGLTIVDLP